ncbi:MAG: hypothetical protein LC739_09765 [Actinobacteria bacterium]|nr:hypothetical protein [Actinomycetota bacterium]
MPPIEATEVGVTLVIPAAPVLPDLYFWALQASFAGKGGTSGGAHIGLQWHTGHPDSTAVNWGGYASDGSILDGSTSALASAMANPHTRDYPWRPGIPYRLVISKDGERGEGWWKGSVIDLEQEIQTEVRSLFSPGDALVGLMVWTEAFCRCEAPPVAAIWSSPSAVAVDGAALRPEGVSLTYQSESSGGCANTDSYELPHGLAQVTGVTRTNQAGAVLRWS